MADEFIDTDKPMRRIDAIWGAFAVEAGGEGVIGILMENNQWVPLIAAEEKRLAWITEQADHIARDRGIKVVICKFSERTEVKVIDRRQ